MIEETSGLNTAIVAEQLVRQNSVNQTGNQRETASPSEEVSQSPDVQNTDTVNLSAEAVALAANVQPATDTNEVEELPPVEQGEEVFTEQQVQGAEGQRAGTIDIRV